MKHDRMCIWKDTDNDAAACYSCKFITLVRADERANMYDQFRGTGEHDTEVQKRLLTEGEQE